MEIPGSSGVWQAPHGMKIPRGWGSKPKVPSFAGGGYGNFLELHNPLLPLWLLGVLILLWDCKSWKALLIILNPTNKTNIIMSYDHFMIILPCQMASLKKVELEAMTVLTILKTISPWMTCTSKELICESRMWWSAKRKTTHYYKTDRHHWHHRQTPQTPLRLASRGKLPIMAYTGRPFSSFRYLKG